MVFAVCWQGNPLCHLLDVGADDELAENALARSAVGHQKGRLATFPLNQRPRNPNRAAAFIILL
jgi:hypothetical protein